jgi:ATP-binding cassette subfamily F protein 3
VALTELMLRKDNVLLLDEPTNHLDMDSREVLEEALEDFEGTIIAISHDRYFINRFAQKVCVLEDGRLKEYLGNYDDYFLKVSRDQEPDGDLPQRTRTAAEKEKRKSREEQRREKEKKEALKALEKEISDAEKTAAEMEARLADPETYRNPEEGARLTQEYHRMKERIDALYERWEQEDM